MSQRKYVGKPYLLKYSLKEDQNQPAHPRSLIRVDSNQPAYSRSDQSLSCPHEDTLHH